MQKRLIYITRRRIPNQALECIQGKKKREQREMMIVKRKENEYLATSLRTAAIINFIKPRL